MTRDGAPRWLDEDEQRVWLGLLAVAMWLPSALDQQLQHDAGISNFEYGVLAHLSTSPGREARMSELARLANSTLPRLSKVADRFERQGWVTRRPDPADGRYTLATLTGGGWDKVVASAPGHVERVRELVFDHLTAGQVRQLGTVVPRLLDGLRPYGAACPPGWGPLPDDHDRRT